MKRQEGKNQMDCQAYLKFKDGSKIGKHEHL